MTWTPRPPHADEPACWSWPLPALARVWTENTWNTAQLALPHDDRLPWECQLMFLAGGGDTRMVDFHQDRCAMCGRGRMILVEDHCHDTGQIRGLLCRSCNVIEGLGARLVGHRYQGWHPAAILDVHDMYDGRDWETGWHITAPRQPGTRPPTPWPAWRDGLVSAG